MLGWDLLASFVGPIAKHLLRTPGRGIENIQVIPTAREIHEASEAKAKYRLTELELQKAQFDQRLTAMRCDIASTKARVNREMQGKHNGTLVFTLDFWFDHFQADDQTCVRAALGIQ
jgi:hypothetical protein